MACCGKTFEPKNNVTHVGTPKILIWLLVTLITPFIPIIAAIWLISENKKPNEDINQSPV